MANDMSNLDLELAALMCSRVCHDVISPVGAIANGLEVLEDEQDEEMQEVALNLIKQSALQASAKLQFARLAFGAAGSEGAEIDLGDAEIAARAFVGSDKVSLDWRAPRETRPKNEVKLLLNMLLIGLSTIPRGGSLMVSAENGALSVSCEGPNANVPDDMNDILTDKRAFEDIDARSVHVYLATRIAACAGLGLEFARDGEKVTFKARPAASKAA